MATLLIMKQSCEALMITGKSYPANGIYVFFREDAKYFIPSVFSTNS